METDKHYFVVGLFILGLMVGGAFFSMWVMGARHSDDIRYRIRFIHSVTGLNEGDPVKFHGVDVGTVESMKLNAHDPRQVVVEVMLRKETPVKTDTKASLRLKGITGVLIVELAGGKPDSPSLLSVTPKGETPEITAAQTPPVMDQLAKLLSEENVKNTSKALSEMRQAATGAKELIRNLKEDPSQLLWGPDKEKDKNDPEMRGGERSRRARNL